ncbi:MAG TPA: NADP-dependent oxidoreductase [Novosphingobium sp.]|nr:NADP-dependent oxidoreductase [Novosphingobium sp.]
MNLVNRRFTLVRRPKGLPVAGDFRIVEKPLPSLGEGEFLLRNHYASIDPAMRGWMDDRPSYVPPISLGDPVRAATVGLVTQSNNADFPIGQWAFGMNAIEDYSVGRPDRFAKLIDPSAVVSVTNYLSAVGTVGLTAYFALLDVGKPKEGETVLVTGAAGGVGSLVGQIAKMMGCRTVGIAGGPAKCDRLLRDYRYDAAIDYRGKSAQELIEAIRIAAPMGVDVHFENVGGTLLDAGLTVINDRARVVLCGLISQYNSDPHPTRNLWQLIVKGARMQGFILSHHMSRIGEAVPELAAWVKQGKLRVDEHIEEGMDNALSALLRLFDGTNDGKMILKIA